MTHQEALEAHAPERYLLGELRGQERERFEEHLFGCTVCAADVENGALFMGAARQHLVEGHAQAAIEPSKKRRLLFFQPAAAFALAAVLLIMVGYQNLVQLPRLRNQLAQAEAPAVLPELVMAGGDSRGSGNVVPSVTLGAADAVLLTVDVPQSLRYERYRISLQRQSGPEIWHTVLPAAATDNAIPLRIPAHMLREGAYRLLVRGAALVDSTSGSGGEPIADYPFTVRRQHE